MNSFARKTGKTFWQALAIILAVSGVLVFFFFNIYQKLLVFLPILIHKIKTACNCPQMAGLSMHPFVFISFLVLGALAVSFLIFAIYKFIAFAVKTKKYSSNYLRLAKPRLSSKLKRVADGAEINLNRIVEIRYANPEVFCFGLLKTKICVSSGLVKILSADELRAVLLHEFQHLQSRDPLKLFIFKYFRSILFFVPGIRIFINKYITFSELAADERATNNFTNRSALANAIFKVTQKEQDQMMRAGLALSFFSSVMDERVNKLSDDNYSPRFRLFSKGFLFGMSAIIIASMSFAVLLTDTSKALAMHGGSCVMEAPQNAGGSCPAHSVALPNSGANSGIVCAI